MSLIWLAEVTAGIEGSPATNVLRVASAPYGYNHPSAAGYYAPAIKQAANLRRAIVANGRTFGGSQLAYGELVIDNISGEYDAWLDYGYGFEGKLLLGDHLADYSTFVTVISGTIEQATGDLKEVVFRFRDRQLELDREISPSVYAGTNSGVTGLEGTPNDIKGQNKIRVFGKVRNIVPDALNINDLVWGVNHDKNGVLAPISVFDGGDGIRVNGSAWTFHANYADATAMIASTHPGQGKYITAYSDGVFQLGGTLEGQITCDVDESATANDNRLPRLVQRLLLDAGVDSGDISAADLTALQAVANYDAGVVVKSETYRAVLDMLAASYGGWYAPNRLGVYNFRQIKDPSGSPTPTIAATFKRFIYPEVAGLGDYKIEQLERLVSNDEGRGIPTWKITVNYQKNWTVQDGGTIAPAVTEETRLYYGLPYRSITVTNTAIRTQYPEAIELVFDTIVDNETDATALANHYLDLYGVRRNLYRLVAEYDVDLAGAIDLGDVVKVFYPRFGLDNGALFNIHGILYDARAKTVELELWG